jgi:uncharacterized protein YggT (Ycf19 family)
MTSPSYDMTARELELRAAEAEHSPIPVFLKIGKVLVWIVYALAVLTASLLVMAFLLRLAGANPGSAFVDWVYRNAELAMRPFRGIFPTHELDGAAVVDVSLLFAALMYLIVALLVDIALRWITHHLRRREVIAQNLRSQADDAAAFAANQHYAADVAAREAAAREYAARQAAAQQATQQYTIAQAAARDVLAAQPPTAAPTAPAEPARPAPPTTATEPPATLPPPG